jgi:protein-tyrosine phosphatase
VYVHCAAGKQRSNAAVAAYRMRHCGWTLEQTLAELEEKYGLDRTAEAALVEHLEKYWRERIAPSRANSQNAPHATR